MPIVIDLQIGDKKTDDALSRLEKALERLEGVQNRFNDSLRETTDKANQAAGAFNRMASGASRASSASSKVKAPPITDPAKAMQEAQRRLSADPNDKGALSMYNQAVKKLNSSKPENQLMTAIMRTRFTKNAAGQIVGMPLGVDLAKFGHGLMGAGLDGGAMGGAAAGGTSLAATGVGAMVVATVTALAAFVAAVNRAANILGDAARGQAVAGGFGGQLMGLNAAAGGDAAGMAMRLQSGISSGGAGFATQAGINPMGGPFGDNDYAGKLQKALKFIANSPSLDVARRRAEGLGIPEAANTFNLSPGNKSQIGYAPEISQAQLQASADFEFNLAKLGTSLERLNVTAFGTFVKDFTGFVDYVNIHLILANDIIKRLTGQGDKKETAVEKNTKAINENTQVIDSLNREFKGAGPRLRGAVPDAIRGGNWEAIGNVRAGAI